MPSTWRRALLAALLPLMCASVWAQEAATADAQACTAHVLSVAAARAGAAAELAGSSIDVSAPREGDAARRPTSGWVGVTLPDVWTSRWPNYAGTVWYRVEFERNCLASAGEPAQPLAIGLGGVSMAGAVYINDDLLWRDASLVEPLSRSWNMPRAFLLPESALHGGINTVWVRVEGLPALSPGLGRLWLGASSQVMQQQKTNLWRQRTVYIVASGMSAAVGTLFLVVWLLRRQEKAFFWYGAMSLCWMAYLASVLATHPWPLSDTLAMSRANIVMFVLYALCFCVFTFRFGQQSLPRVEKLLWVLASLGIAAVVLAPAAMFGNVIGLVWLGFLAVIFANCLQFQWHAWRTRDPQHVLLALCWLVLLVVGLHDVVVILNKWTAQNSWSAVTGPVATVFMALLLGRRMVANTQRIERFNHELRDAVEQAREQLAQVLAREHHQAIEQTKLHERLQIAHDLHDGLGGSLVRSMALVELAPQQLTNERVLSLFKVLRDDLRQVIDTGSSAGAVVPASPVQWAAPTRHRFTRILDELGVKSDWQMDTQWQGQPSALQCLGLTRLMEEALSNVIKHSRASRVRVSCEQPQSNTLVLRIEDDGVGFDVEAVQHAGLSVGMRSMHARAERIGATLQVQSGSNGTTLVVEQALTPS